MKTNPPTPQDAEFHTKYPEFGHEWTAKQGPYEIRIPGSKSGPDGTAHAFYRQVSADIDSGVKAATKVLKDLIRCDKAWEAGPGIWVVEDSEAPGSYHLNVEFSNSDDAYGEWIVSLYWRGSALHTQRFQRNQL